jgi:hypothetical protein
MEKAKRRFFTEDYKRQTVELVRSSGRSIGSVAAALLICHQIPILFCDFFDAPKGAFESRSCAC